MTEGGIASWKIKEGDTFTTGDVLVEIVSDMPIFVASVLTLYRKQTRLQST